MALRSSGAGLRVRDAFRRAGQLVTLRFVADLSSAEVVGLGLPAPASAAARTKNPPTLLSPRINRSAAIGATTVAITAAQAQGLITAGDEMRVIGHTTWLKVATPAVANVAAHPLAPATPGFTVLLEQAVPADLPAGTDLAIEFRWAADTEVWVRPYEFPLGLVDGERILTGDLRAGVPAYGLPRAPRAGDRILITPERIDAEIINVRPFRLPGGDFSHFDIQAR